MTDAAEFIFWKLIMVIKYKWVLLDTEIIVSVTNNELFVTDLRQCISDDVITILVNGGSQIFDKAGMLGFWPFLCILIDIQWKQP